MSTNSRASTLAMPLYRASPVAAIIRFFRKYATFTGRASRSEYWWWILVAALVPLLIQLITGSVTGRWQFPLPPIASAINQLFALAVLVPTVALTWRRLHDTGRSGFWSVAGLVPVVGWLLLLVLLLQPASPAGQRFDP